MSDQYQIRLYDRLMAGRWNISPSNECKFEAKYEWEAFAESFYEELRGTACIVADNVAEFCEQFQEGTRLNQIDMPNLIPPWPSFFVEWRVLDAKQLAYGYKWAGALCVSHEDQGRSAVTILPMVANPSTSTVMITPPTAFSYSEHGEITGWRFPDNSEGFDTTILPPIMAMVFANCQNTRVVDWLSPSPALAKSFERRNERKLSPFKWIEITPMTRLISERIESEGKGADRGAIAFHEVRAHIGKYGPKFGKGKLFGKHEGTYLFSSHSRGSKDSRQRVAGYRLNLHGKSSAA